MAFVSKTLTAESVFMNMENKNNLSKTYIHQLNDMSLSKLQEMVKDREASCAAVHAVAKSQTGLNVSTTILCFWWWTFLLYSIDLVGGGMNS